MKRRKVAVIGIDSVPPELLWDRYLNELPTLKDMAAQGIRAKLRSCDPPITVPAWQVMMTSHSPGRLGVFGFRERKGNSYTEMNLVTSRSFQTPTVWDLLAAHDRRSALIGVPPGYPPKPIHGHAVACHLTPSAKSRYTYPEALQDELEAVAGPYIPDVVFRSGERERVLSQLIDMSEQHAKMEQHLLRQKPWDFFMTVEIATDRVHHVFWKFVDPEHPKYTDHPAFRNGVLELYRSIDRRIHRILSCLDDQTIVLVVSDHGAKAMHGAFCLNEWLIERGYLKLKRYPADVTRLELADVDWAKTRVWGWGGYYARVFFNVRGREPQGLLSPREAEQLRGRLVEELDQTLRPDGRPLGASALPVVTNGHGNVQQASADLMLYFGDLSWRSAGTIGHRRLFLDENDTGPDDAVHSQHGIFLYYDPQVRHGRVAPDLHITDVAPTILRAMGEPIPDTMEGQPLEVLG